MNEFFKRLSLQKQLGATAGVASAIGALVAFGFLPLIDNTPLWGALVVLFSALLPLVVLLFLIHRWVVLPMTQLSAYLSELGREGDLVWARRELDRISGSIAAGSGNEIHELFVGLNELVASQEILAEQARAIGADDLWNGIFQEANVQGDLSAAFAHMVAVLRDLSTQVQRIAEGDLSQPDGFRSLGCLPAVVGIEDALAETQMVRRDLDQFIIGDVSDRLLKAEAFWRG